MLSLTLKFKFNKLKLLKLNLKIVF